MRSGASVSWAFKPRLYFFLFCLVCFSYLFWLTYQSLGVFVGSLRADEIHFLQNSWMAYSERLAIEYVPPLYHYLLTFLWGGFGGDVYFIYILRLFSFLLFCVQGVLIFKIFSLSFPSLRNKYFSVVFAVLSAAFVVLLAAFRGYEIRPEGLGNTLLLLGFFWLFLNHRINSVLRYGFYLVVCISLVVAASLSFRFVLPSFFLWIAAAVQLLRNNEMARLRNPAALAVAVALSFSAVVVVDYLFIDWERVLEGLGRYSLISDPMSWTTRFTINTWAYYWVLCCLVLGVAGVLGWRAVMASQASSSVRLVNALLFLPIFSFYFFLFMWDVSPRGYIHSIEWILIFGVLLFSLKTATVSKEVSFFFFLIFVVTLLYLSQKAVSDLSVHRNSKYFIERILNSQNLEGMIEKNDSSLIKYFDSASALPDQINSRREFCSRHRDSFVISGSILYHPICLVDMGTYDFSGWGNKKVDLLGLPPDQRLIILSATADQLTSLASHYGERYKSMPNVSIVDAVLKN